MNSSDASSFQSNIETAEEFGISIVELRLLLTIRHLKTTPDYLFWQLRQPNQFPYIDQFHEVVTESEARAALLSLLGKQLVREIDEQGKAEIEWIVRRADPLTIIADGDAIPRVGTIEFTPVGGMLFDLICHNRESYEQRLFHEELKSADPPYENVSPGTISRQTLLLRGCSHQQIADYIAKPRLPHRYPTLRKPFGCELVTAHETVSGYRISEPTQLWRLYWWQTPLPMWTGELDLIVEYQ
jgi:hypothetical protein